MKVLVLNGPNINLLGKREPDIYGNKTYENLVDYVKEVGEHLGVDVDVLQSNSEGQLIDIIQNAENEYYGIVANLGAYSHYSLAIHDAIKSQPLPVVEVHLSNIHAREEFRSKSYTAMACIGIISGFGFTSYALGLQAIVDKTQEDSQSY